MALSVELLLNVAFWIALAFLPVTWIWKTISSNSFGSRVAALMTHTALTAIEVGQLTVCCLAGEKYEPHLLLVFVLLFNVVLSALYLRD